MAVLRTPVELRGENLTTVSEFSVKAGETVPFVLTYDASHLPLPKPIDPMRALSDTEAFWSEWSQQGKYDGEYRDLVQRSLITLKALTYRPTGGIVAAPTTSLPEKLGGSRNWDYRFCWLRDAAATLHCAHEQRIPLRGSRMVQLAACARLPDRRPKCRSCTASPASGVCSSGKQTGCRATSDRGRCVSAMPLMLNCSSTSTAS